MIHRGWSLCLALGTGLVLAGCTPCRRGESDNGPDAAVIQAMRGFLAEAENEKRGQVWDSILCKLLPGQTDLCVRTFAAIYWSGRSKDYGCTAEYAAMLIRSTQTDRAYEETMRIALYSKEWPEVRGTMYALAFYQRIELFPFYSQLLKRSGLPSDIAHGARTRQVYCVYPLTSTDAYYIAVRSKAWQLPAEEGREAFRKAWNETLTATLPGSQFGFEASKKHVIAQRRAKGFQGELYPPAYPGPDGEVRVILGALKQGRK